VVISGEVLQKRRSRGATPGELRVRRAIPMGDTNPSHVCDVGVMRRASQESCNDSIMEISRGRAKRSWTPAHSRVADTRLMTS
jgi:hypothetical protein